MILGGDEIARTQQGNNNAYSQDNQISWYAWDAVSPLEDFVQRLTALRKHLQILQTGSSDVWRGPTAHLSVPDVACLDPGGGRVTDPTKSMSAFQLFFNGRPLAASDRESGELVGDDVLLLLNASPRFCQMALPSAEFAPRWRIVLDTFDDVQGTRELEPRASLGLKEFSMIALASDPRST
jgi:glycogen operon protein